MLRVEQIEEIARRWKELFNVEYSVRQVTPVANLEIFFRDDLLHAKDYKKADELLRQIEEVDTQYKIDCENRKVEEETNKFKSQIKEALKDTDWTQLADAPLSSNGKKLYREYRQYLRDIPDLWKRRQILELTIMTFEEWREDPPQYKVERKVIL